MTNRSAAEKLLDEFKDVVIHGTSSDYRNARKSLADIIERACPAQNVNAEKAADLLLGAYPELHVEFGGIGKRADEKLMKSRRADIVKFIERACGQDEEPGFDEATETRWQTAIYELCKKDYPEVDGSGCESGDALDVTLSEISQTIELVRESACGETAPCELCDAVDHYMKECPPSPPTGRTNAEEEA